MHTSCGSKWHQMVLQLLRLHPHEPIEKCQCSHLIHQRYHHCRNHIYPRHQIGLSIHLFRRQFSLHLVVHHTNRLSYLVKNPKRLGHLNHHCMKHNYLELQSSKKMGFNKISIIHIFRRQNLIPK